MERQELMDQILSRVQQKLAEYGVTVSEQEIEDCLSGSAAAEDGECGKPGLLILTEEHGDFCHTLLESPRLKAKFRTECALLEENKIDINQYEAVVLFQLSNVSVAKLSAGMGDTPYTALAMKALLSGKKLYAVREEVELFRYQESAPAPYYEMLKKQLDFLVGCGLQICCADRIEDALLGETPQAACVSSKPEEPVKKEAPQEPVKKEREVRASKRVITERDIIEADREGVTCIHLKTGSIVTDLARETASRRDIRLVRD